MTLAYGENAGARDISRLYLRHNYLKKLDYLIALQLCLAIITSMQAVR
jgi:hypothetical protein